MSKNVVVPKSVSFEDALRNLAAKLTGQPAAKLPRAQESIVWFMAENVPAPDEMAEAITQEVLARLAVAAAPAGEAEGPQTAQREDKIPGTEATVAASGPKRGSKADTTK